MGNFSHSWHLNIYLTQNKERRQLLRKRDKIQKAGIFLFLFLLNGIFFHGKQIWKENSEGAFLKKPQKPTKHQNQQPPQTNKQTNKKLH